MVKFELRLMHYNNAISQMVLKKQLKYVSIYTDKVISYIYSVTEVFEKREKSYRFATWY